MINFFYTYSFIAMLVWILYGFGWSDFCQPLCFELNTFLCNTIIISFILGYVLRGLFRLKLNNDIHLLYPKAITLFIVAFYIIECIYSKNVTLISILSGNLDAYGKFGIPSFHVFLVTFSSYYSQCLYIAYLNKKDKSYLYCLLIIIFFIFILSFNRGGLIFLGVIIFNDIIFFYKKSITLKNTALLICLSLVVLWLFGAAGNLRQGFSFNDSSYIEKIGKINDNYPEFLPKEFFWSYIYICSPLFNLNHNLANENVELNFVHYIKNFMPDFINKRLYPNEHANVKLVCYTFNVTVGFGGAYVSGGLIGLYCMYVFLFMFFIVNVQIYKKGYSRFITLSVINSIVVFFFFSNTISASVFSFQLVYPFLDGVERLLSNIIKKSF